MSRTTIQNVVDAYLRQHFGGMVVVRDVRRTRGVVSESWMARAVVPSRTGDIDVAELEVDDEGRLKSPLAIDDVVDAIARSAQVARDAESPPSYPMSLPADFGDMMADPRVAESDDGEVVAPSAREVFDRAMARGDKASLRGARDILPWFLADAELRGQVLTYMAEIEVRLGEKSLAHSYLEAASRDFAARFDIAALEACARAARTLLGDSAYEQSRIAQLLVQNGARHRPS